MRRRAGPRLADADDEPRDQQLRETRRHPAGKSRRAEKRKGARDDVAAALAIRDIRDGNAEDGVNKREANAGEEAYPCVGYVKDHLQLLGDDGDHEAIDHIDGINPG